MAQDVKIENMVSAIKLGVDIDLRKFVSKVRQVEYNPENFPGVVYRLHEPKVAMLIFSSGNVICTGARNEKDIDQAIIQLREKLRQGGVRVKGEPIVKIQNIVASSAIDDKVNLDQLAIESFNTEYEPEQFPGLVYKVNVEPKGEKSFKATFLLFSNGKVVCTGTKSEQQVHQALDALIENLKKVK